MYYCHTITGNTCVYTALGLLMTSSQWTYNIYNLEVELTLIFRAYFPWTSTAEEGKISSFCSSVANYFPVIKYKRRLLLKKEKKKEEEEKGQEV